MNDTLFKIRSCGIRFHIDIEDTIYIADNKADGSMYAANCRKAEDWYLGAPVR